jgi:hypothetical protein
VMYYNVRLNIGQAKASPKGKFLVCVALLMSLQGCSAKAWYEGFKERERSRCYHYRTTEEINDCLDQVEAMSYDQYRREHRKESSP